ncbi:MAG: hypothetical protein PHV54_00920 [Tolumonas sp.]|nr:hypothetical protein [Tolumonas sp.]
MDMVDPEIFLPIVRRHITGPLEIMMRAAVVEAAIIFCRNSKYLVDSKTLTGVIAGQAITVCTDDNLKSSDLNSIVGGDGELLSGGIDYIAISANQLKALRDIPSMTIGYNVEPIQSASSLPKPIYDDHAETIAFGAAKILYLQPGMPWTDGKRAQLYGAEFTEGYRRAARFRLAQSNELVQSEFSNPVRARGFF